MMVNACVTGILPGFRYVLLTDALIDSLTPLEMAAVFGHEIGHIAHRHLLYFGFFFMGSLGVLTILGEMVSRCGPWVAQLAWLTPWTPAFVSEVVQGVLLLGLLGLYFWIVFGQISRRFERQADVFGSKVVSCDLADCPPHTRPGPRPFRTDPVQGKQPTLCPVGIRIFAEASRMSPVSTDSTPTLDRGGMAASPAGSHFLEVSSSTPSGRRQFQRGVVRLRIGLGVVLVAAMVISVRCPARIDKRQSKISQRSSQGDSGICPRPWQAKSWQSGYFYYCAFPLVWLVLVRYASGLASAAASGGNHPYRLVPTTRRSSCSDGPFDSS